MLSIVLSRQNLREHDQVISLYTLEHGKKEMLARGAKKLLSKNSAYLEPGCLIEAEVIPGKELAYLGSVEPVDVLVLARKSLINTVLLGWSTGLVKDLTHTDECDQRVFKLLFNWIKFLNTSVIEDNTVFLADIFMARFLQLLGFDISHDERVEKSIRADLDVLSTSSWSKVCKLKLAPKNGEALHNIIFKFAGYHSEKKLQNWSKFAYFS